MIDSSGFDAKATRILSPNFDPRPSCDINLVVIHNISLPPKQYGGNGIIELFTNQLDPNAHPYYAKIADLKVSSHFLIRRDGTLIQFVSCLDRAWHAGQSCWLNRQKCNDFSIGIELEGDDESPFEQAQYDCLNQLLSRLYAAFPINAITGHSDIAPGRKTDPGPYFDWNLIPKP